MRKKSSLPFKLLILSSIATVFLVVISCYLWTDFDINQVVNVMFWVGAVVIIAGGSNFFPSNTVQGQSEAAMYSLRYKNSEAHQGTIDKKESELTRRMIRGTFIALPGLLLVVIALFLNE